MDESAQRRLFESLGSFSTFIWIRVDANHLKLKPEEVRACIHKVRCLREEVPASALSIQADGALRDFDLAEIEAASRSLRAGNAAEFVPGELTPNEANVLMAAAKLHARELQFEGHVEMTSLETRFLPGGRSTARIGVLRVNRSGRPLVAKIDAKSRVQDEMKRFRTFIQPWDDELRPKLHFHGEAAVILFGLVPNEMDRTKPAEVLEDRLRAVWNNQLFAANSDAELERQREALTLGVENAARRLGELNSTSPPSSELTPLGNPDVGATFDKLARAGIDWALAEVTKTAFEKASARFKKHEVSATIHGDVHLRNILVRGDRDAHLIDYAGSGPGHPSVDLVRLELALFLGALRQLDGEARCAEYQKRLSIDLDSYEVLEAAFPALHRCRLNQVCLRGSVAAREQALKVLGQYGGGQEDYLAAKYVIAWQHLVMFGSHTGLARAMIESLAPAIAAW